MRGAKGARASWRGECAPGARVCWAVVRAAGCAAGAQQARAVPCGQEAAHAELPGTSPTFRNALKFTGRFEIQVSAKRSLKSAESLWQCAASCPHGTARACCAPAAQPAARTTAQLLRPEHTSPAPPGSLRGTHICTASARRHAEQAHAPTLAPTCVVSEPVKVRPATDPACHCLPPPGLLTLVLCVAAPQPDGRPSPSSHTRSSHRPRPARTARIVA